MSGEQTDPVALKNRQGACATTPPRLPWYRQAFEADYLDLYVHRDLAEAARAVRFLSRALGLDGAQRLLDLCCGPGRHLVFLGQFVRQAVGLDLSRVLLERAKEHWRAAYGECGTRNAECGMNFQNYAKDRKEDTKNHKESSDNDYEKNVHAKHSQPTTHNSQLIQSDMRHLPFAPASFDRVVNLFTSFGYFEREEDNAAVLAEIARVLQPGGLLALDHINREAMLAHLRPQTERDLPDGRVVIEKRRWDPSARRVIKDVTCREPGGQVKGWSESVRVYEPEELEGLLAAAGLGPAVRHGDYEGHPWRPDAPRLILIAKRE